MGRSANSGALSESIFYILLRLHQPAHGYALMKDIAQMTNERVSLGAGSLYGALDALQKKCAADGVKLKTYVGRGMVHTWAAISWLPEAKVTRQRIYDYIKRA